MSAGTALRLGRVSNLPTVWTNVAAGLVLAGGAVRPGTYLPLAVALSLFYVGGMYLNDAFDREVDARERPSRPIPSGEVTARTVFAAGFALLAAGEGVLVAWAAAGASWGPAAGGAALAAAIVWYDARHKRDPLAPVVMGLCRVLVYVTAALAVTAAPGAALAGGALALLAYLIGLTYVARQETLAEVRNLWPVACLAVPFAHTAGDALASATTAALWVGLLAWVVLAVGRLVRRGRADVPGAVVRLIAGISLLDALLMAAAGAPRTALAAAAAVPLTRLLQRHVPGT
jgi:4-hydroxybenzoate polyprenyltransferase